MAYLHENLTEEFTNAEYIDGAGFETELSFFSLLAVGIVRDE